MLSRKDIIVNLRNSHFNMALIHHKLDNLTEYVQAIADFIKFFYEFNELLINLTFVK